MREKEIGEVDRHADALLWEQDSYVTIDWQLNPTRDRKCFVDTERGRANKDLMGVGAGHLDRP